MKAYMYCAAMYCGPCGENLRAQLDAAGKRPADPNAESTYDSDDYPKGPYSAGGGEADTPQHCDACGVHLENPLTPDGVAYVADAIRAFDQEGDGTADVIATWREFYRAAVTEYNESLWNENGRRSADHIDGYDRDDLGESPDY